MKFTANLTKLLATGVLLGTAMLPLYAQAAVTLKVDDHIKVTAINGQEIGQSLLQPLTKEFTLAPGKHVITAKYDRLYDLRRDEHDYLRSGNVSVAAEMQDNQTYTLSMLGQPEEYRAAKEYVKQPTLAVTQGTTVVASQKGMVNNDSGIFSGLGNALGGIFGGGSDAQAANQRAIASLEQTGSLANTSGTQAIPAMAPLTQTTQTVATPAPAVNSNAATLDQFMQLWLKASPAEREKMRQWIQQ